ncbi:hypothetical protein [Cloacibacillus sp. An23]|uniref:hypothetical protein n=1 Tax=Cloacibacillus sp. An23 TaxID=1965591 RepID=UPI000B3A5C60|nr:hypothetical protein [Cloacibacillus sp. An23]OUO94772.1 hypothetical protein B5F39_02575 [Cloacibacillus sp. An23]
MKREWIPFPEGEIYDPVFEAVARRAGVSRGKAVLVYIMLINHVMKNGNSCDGHYVYFDTDTCDAAFDFAEGTSAAVVRALKDKDLIDMEDGSCCLTRWVDYAYLEATALAEQDTRTRAKIELEQEEKSAPVCPTSQEKN